jgi:isochorismate synthase
MAWQEQNGRLGALELNRQVDAIYNAAVEAGAAIAVWQRPGMTHPQAVIDLSATPTLAPINFAARQPAFVFAPFVSDPAGAALQLHADLWFDGQTLHTHNGNGSHDRARRGAHFFAMLNAAPASSPRAWYQAETLRNHAATEREFTALVGNAIDFIRSTGIAKVVVSRTAALPLPASFTPAAAFAMLCERYPHAFVSLVAIPGAGTWLGATPEVLLTLDNAGLTTMALAGTQRRPLHQPLDAVQWGRKEVVEQEMVGAYIRGFFASAGVADVQEHGPHTIAAGPVVHLQTLFRADLPEEARLMLANRVLNELHPTSAVCGMPKHQALAFILAQEGYDRSFYSGFLGPVHIQGASSLYVNLRCMQLGEESAHLYVGAGITADSNPAAEWRETALKAETMAAVLASEAQATQP